MRRTKNHRKGPEAFDVFYEDMYGLRWPALRESMKKEPVRCLFDDGLIKPYYMDRASILVSRSLDVLPGQSVLDMCAAPGGKTLILAVALRGSGILVANDRSSARRARLRTTLESHLPDELLEIITITGHDAQKWGMYEQNVYDRILLDAPCSSERHLLRSPTALTRWSPSRTTRLQIQSTAMLLAAIDALKPGGVLIYSTCAISEYENQKVVERALKKRTDVFEVIEHRSLFPDDYDGMGPMFYCKIRKNAATVPHQSIRPDMR